ncbi:hypothetical protein PG990_002822 [Apiospora arundinis]
MEAISKLREGILSWGNIATIVVVYFATLSIYRLMLHPLASFPGPKLAAITRYYEAYYDLVRTGQYTFKITELHKKYGNPYELHVMDPSFYEKIYCQGHWEKYAWINDAFNVDGSTLNTVPHELHRARRQPLNHFFSKVRVSAQQEVIDRHIVVFYNRMLQFAVTGKMVDLGAAISALTRDIVCDFLLNKSYAHLEKEDFNVQVTDMFQSGGTIWRVSKHIRWFAPALRAIPMSIMERVADPGTKAFFSYIQASEQDTSELLRIASIPSSSPDAMDESERTIVHEMVDSKLPPAEKRFERVMNDVTTITSAGFETTAGVLRLIIYHVFSNPDILRRLRVEPATVNAAAPPSSSPLSSYYTSVQVKALEQLPYLTAVITEGLRLSPGIGSRSPRVAPDRDLFYGDGNLCIPAGTPVGMTTILMHLDETLYPKPLSFNPDRWMEADFEARKRLNKVYAPFSKGERICLGMHFAWASMYVIVAQVVQQFDFEFKNVVPKHFEMDFDQFIIKTKGNANLDALVTMRKA